MSEPLVSVDLRMLEASGVGTYLRNLVPRLLRRSGRRWALLGDVEAIRRSGLAAHRSATAIPLRAPIYSIREQLAMTRRVPAETALFWAPHYNLPLRSPGRLLVTVHDLMHLALPEYSRGLHRRAYARFMFGALRRRADRVICVSHFTARELVRLVGVEPRRITVVHEGVDAAWFEDEPGPSPHARPYLLFVGNVKPHKNLVRLVQAFEALASDVPHDLLIVGKREGFRTGDPRVLQAAGRMAGRIRFTGYVPDERLRSYVRHAGALVLPSLYEGFGLPPLEAMASGCPVVVSRAASLPEVCGDAALYCDPLDPHDIAAQIRRAVNDATLRAELVDRGRLHARRFTWERCAEQTAAVMEAMV